MKHMFQIGDVQASVWLTRQSDGEYLIHFEQSNTVASASLANGMLTINSTPTKVHVAHQGDKLFVHLDGTAHELEFLDPVRRHGAHLGGQSGDVLVSPMPGVVVACQVEKGNVVKAGDAIIVIESMKLETTLTAPRDGIVDTVHLTVGESFERDTVLVSLEKEH